MQLDALQTLALSVAQATSPAQVLDEMVRGLGMTEGVALARVWLIEDEGDKRSLRLRASVGFSIVDPGVRWSRTDGGHQHIPLSYGKVGTIASTGRPLLLQRGPRDWLLQPEWAERERIESFAGQPLAFKGETLGVVALFSRKRLGKDDLDWLRVFADHAAVAIANARAFEEIAGLKERLERENAYLRREIRWAVHPGPLIAESRAMQRVLDEVHAVARTNANVLILGESGVGKELVAAAIHEESARSEQPLVKVNCASIPRELFESEFFGHVRGAFSGASRQRAGRFALADGGTLFLDEVGEIPLELQGKLLRVLQEGQFEPVGDDRTRRVDVRIIAATNRDLETEIRAGRFRQDLYYRLKVVPIAVPPLRERPEDIVPMARQFLLDFARHLNVKVPLLTSDDERSMTTYEFPGNVRELRNVIERAVVMARSTDRRLSLHLPAPSVPAVAPALLVSTAQSDDTPLAPVIPAARFREMERENIVNALRHCNGRIAGRHGAAALLGLKPSTLSYQMKALGIRRGE
ncbi:MAG TPA: sigma 54-interacting transcriptional regulator [Polyangiaceae bacterium]